MAYWHDIVPLISRLKRPTADKVGRPERMKELHHTEYQIVATILKHSPTIFEVRYYGNFNNSQEDGWRLSVPQDILSEKGMLRFEVLTYADSVESAELIAHDELKKLAIIYKADILHKNDKA